MGFCLGKSTSGDTYRRWTDLPQEIAGLILSRLPSHDDRLCFGAVCRDWRLAAKHQRTLLPPAMPCINLGDGEYQSIIDGKVRRFPVPSDCRVDASMGSCLLFEHQPSGRCFLHDPFSGNTPAIEVPCRYIWRPHRGAYIVGSCDPYNGGWSQISIEKIFLGSPQLVVATFLFQGGRFYTAGNFACFRPGRPPLLSWSRAAATAADEHHGANFLYKDLAFHHGKIFAIGRMGDLLTHEFVEDLPSKSRITHLIKQQPNASYAHTKCHLVTSADKQKLLMVQWSIIQVMNGHRFDHHVLNLHVFEADLDKGQWSEVKDLGEQVLFVGPNSKSFAVTGPSKHYHPSFRGGNLVFLLGNDWVLAWKSARSLLAVQCMCSNCRKFVSGSPSYCVYDMVTGKTSIVVLNRGRSPVKSSRSEWFFPSR